MVCKNTSKMKAEAKKNVLVKQTKPVPELTQNDKKAGEAEDVAEKSTVPE